MPFITGPIMAFSSYYCNPYAIPVLLTGLVVVAFGISVFSNQKDSPVNASFLAFCISIGLWLTGESLMYVSKEAGLARFWYGVAFLGVSMISATLFSFTVFFLKREKQLKKMILLGYVLACVFFYFSIHSGHLIIGMKKYFWGWYPQYGPFSFVFLSQFGAFLVACIWLYVGALRKTAAIDEHNRVKYVLTGFLISYVALVDYIATFGIAFFPFGYIPILCLVAIIAYAMKKYNLFLTPSMAAETIVNTMADALIVFGIEGKILSVNPVTAYLFGYSQEELAGKPVQDIFAEKNIFRKETLLSLATFGPAQSFAVTGLNKEGISVPVSLSIGAVKNKYGVAGFVCIARDVRETQCFVEELKNKARVIESELSERKKAEASLKNAYEQLQSAQGEIKGAQQELRRNFDLQRVLNSLLRYQLSDVPIDDILKHTLNEILNIPWLEFESKGTIFLAEGDTGILVMKVQNGFSSLNNTSCTKVPIGKWICERAALSGKIELLDHLDPLTGQEDEIIVHGHYSVPMFYSSGKVLGVINVYVKAGHQRNKNEEDFLTVVADILSSILNYKYLEKEKEKHLQELKELDKMKSWFVSNVSHEIRTPITAIGGALNLLKKIYSSDSANVKTGVFLELITRNIGRIQNLVNDLLDFSRMEQGQFKLIYSLFNLNELIREFVQDIQLPFKDKHLTFTTEFPVETKDIYADREKLGQVIANLMGNAAKFTPENGWIKVGYVFTGDARLLFHITDSGPGVPPDQYGKIFEKFYQIDGSLQREHGGFGLGLAIVKSIVEKHNGRIWVESGEGKGATFFIDLPCVPRKPDAQTGVP
jgi:PAS domain S-box-containing protein